MFQFSFVIRLVVIGKNLKKQQQKKKKKKKKKKNCQSY